MDVEGNFHHASLSARVAVAGRPPVAKCLGGHIVYGEAARGCFPEHIAQDALAVGIADRSAEIAIADLGSRRAATGNTTATRK